MTGLDFCLDNQKNTQFDDLLENARISELESLLAEKKYLVEPEKLKEKLTKLRDNLNFIFKEVDNVGLS